MAHEQTIDFADSGGTKFRYVVQPSQLLGRGSFGVVHVATESRNGVVTKRSVAVKQSQYRADGTENLLQLRKELEDKLNRIISVKSPNVTEYYHVKVDGSKIKNTLDPLLRTVAVMEYCNLGSLENFIKSNKLPNDQIKSLIKQIVNGLFAIHDHRILHTDLKTANIVLSSSPTAPHNRIAKITDLDDHIALLSTVTVTNEISTLRGTVLFMSPEMLTGGQNGYTIGRETDIWSMGCIIVELYRKEKDFCFVKMISGMKKPAEVLNVQKATREGITDFVKTGGIPEIPGDMPDVARDMVERCFMKDPKKRITAENMLHSVWFDTDDSFRTNTAPTYGQEPAGTGHVEFIINNGDFIPPPDDELKWEVRMACAARVLVHHIPDTHFPYQYKSFYKNEINLVRKVIEPGEPLDPKYHEWMDRLLQSKGPIAYQFNPIARLAKLAVKAITPRVSAIITMFLPTIGPSFPGIAEWMNQYTHDYEYVCKGNATWAEIKMHIDQKEPVIAQVQLRDLPIGDMVKRIATWCGYGVDCPPTFPYICAMILKGYEGNNAQGEPATVIYTDPYGVTKTMEYQTFKTHANWIATNPGIKEAFDIAGYQPGQIIYRTKKGTGVVGTSRDTVNDTVPDVSETVCSTAHSSPTPPIFEEYTIKSGDTLSGIGKRFGVPYRKIAEDNGLADPNKILAGSKLKIRRDLMK